MAGNRTRVNCLEGSYAHHYTTIASHHSAICAAPELPLQKHFLERRSRKGEEREERGGKSGRERWEGARGGEETRVEVRREADSNSLLP